MVDLPAHGEVNWDTKLNAAITEVETTANDAETPAGAQAKADAAKASAEATAASLATTAKTEAIAAADAAAAARDAALTAASVGAKPSSYVPDWTEVTGKPTTFTPATHSHGAGDVTSGTFSLAQLPVATSGTNTNTALVRADDTRLSDARTPTTHTHTASQISDSTATGRSVLTAASASAARTAIGAGTSSLALGTTSSTAKAGSYTPPIADLPAGTTLTVYYSGGAWPSRPTSRTDVTVQWIDPTGAAAGPAGAVSGVDVLIQSAV